MYKNKRAKDVLKLKKSFVRVVQGMDSVDIAEWGMDDYVRITNEQLKDAHSGLNKALLF